MLLVVTIYSNNNNNNKKKTNTPPLGATPPKFRNKLKMFQFLFPSPEKWNFVCNPKKRPTSTFHLHSV